MCTKINIAWDEAQEAIVGYFAKHDEPIRIRDLVDEINNQRKTKGLEHLRSFDVTSVAFNLVSEGFLQFYIPGYLEKVPDETS
jgi:hypothetical protein